MGGTKRRKEICKVYWNSYAVAEWLRRKEIESVGGRRRTQVIESMLFWGQGP